MVKTNQGVTASHKTRKPYKMTCCIQGYFVRAESKQQSPECPAGESCQHRLGNLHTAVRVEFRSDELLIRTSLSSVSLSSPGHKTNTALPLCVLLVPPPPFQKFYSSWHYTQKNRLWI